MLRTREPRLSSSSADVVTRAADETADKTADGPSPEADTTAADPEVAGEQEYVHRLYDRLESLREHAGERLADALRQTGGTPQARSERDDTVAMYSDQLAQFSAVENGLCFGRLDLRGGGHRATSAGSASSTTTATTSRC